MPANRLNATERREIDAISEQWLSRAFCTDPIDETLCRNAVAKAYALEGLTTPEIIFCRNPIEAMTRLQRLSPDAGSSVPRPVPEVANALEKIVVAEPEAWLLYTQGSNSLWAEACEYAALEAALALGHVRTPPAALAAGRELLASCGWIYSFERLCLVCDRPSGIEQQKNRREVRTNITWRDGVRCDRIFS